MPTSRIINKKSKIEDGRAYINQTTQNVVLCIDDCGKGDDFKGLYIHSGAHVNIGRTAYFYKNDFKEFHGEITISF